MPGISGIDVLRRLRDLRVDSGLHRHDRLRHRRHRRRGDEARRGRLRAEAVLPRRTPDARPLGGGSPPARAPGRSAAAPDARRRHRSMRCSATATAMRRVKDLIGRAAAAPGTVLVTGETGTGKELVARALHARSAARRGPFVALNCAALTDSLLENELFGHARGAFTGAAAARAGLIEHATRRHALPRRDWHDARGAPGEAAARAGGRRGASHRRERRPARRRALHRRHQRRPAGGGRSPERSAATSSTASMCTASTCRRCATVPGDIDQSARSFFLERYRPPAAGSPASATGPAPRSWRYDYPGNVRQLEHVIQRAVAVARGPVLRG